MDRPGEIARWLQRQQAECSSYAPLPPELHLRDADEAYAVQAAFQTLQRDAKGALAGGKIALTTPVMQALVNYHQPMAGGILERTIHRQHADLPWRDFVHPLVECEVAVELGADLPAEGAPYTAASVAPVVAACMAAIEVADDRAADYKAIDPLLLIAENAWNHGCVLGPRITDWRRLDLPKAKGTTTIAGTEAGAGYAGDVMDGHPFAALAWLANHAVRRGSRLRRGDVVLTGSLVASKWPGRGDLVTIAIDGLGESSVRFA